MNSPASLYQQMPWLEHYGPEVPKELSAFALKSLPALFSYSAQTYAKRPAFTTCMPNGMSGSLNFDQVNEMSDALAIYLREELGLKAGTRVAVQMPNCLSYPLAAFAVLKAGCVLVNINPLYTASEMKHQFKDSGAEALFIIDMFADKLDEALEGTKVQSVILASVAEFFPSPVNGIIRATLKYWNRVIPKLSKPYPSIRDGVVRGRKLRVDKAFKAETYWQELGPKDLALLQYTGGTTGVAKGAMLSHGNILANVQQIEAVTRYGVSLGEDTILTALPLYHIFAFTANLISFHYLGTHNILVPSPRPVSNVQRAIENYSINWITGVNTLFNALMNEEWFSVYPPKHLKAVVAGGASLHEAVARRWKDITKVEIIEGYGLSETSPLLTVNPLGGQVKIGSIGLPVPGTEIRLVDDIGQDVAPGEAGELIARGPQVMEGYWQKPEETAQVIKEGWFYTGDVATMDDQGYFRIVDRKKDIILVSGFNVYPNEIEDNIALLDGVLECAVIGVPDASTGEAVRAYVVKRDPDLTAEQVREHCKKKLTGYKCPKQIEFREELPKTPVGKVLRKNLRAEVISSNSERK